METEKDHNKETKMLGETIRSQRQLDLQAGHYGFLSASNGKKSFTAFFDAVAESKRKTTSKSNYDSYVSISKYVRAFAGEDCTIADVERFFIEYFQRGGEEGAD